MPHDVGFGIENKYVRYADAQVERHTDNKVFRRVVLAQHLDNRHRLHRDFRILLRFLRPDADVRAQVLTVREPRIHIGGMEKCRALVRHNAGFNAPHCHLVYKKRRRLPNRNTADYG